MAWLRSDWPTGRIRMPGHGNPRGRGRLLLHDLHPAKGIVEDSRVPDDLFEERGRDDQCQCGRRIDESSLQGVRVQQPEGVVDGGRRDPVHVPADLAGMQRHAQAYLFLPRMATIVLVQRGHQSTGKCVRDRTFGDVRRYEKEHSVTTVLDITGRPRNAHAFQRLPDEHVQPLAHGDPMTDGAARVAESRNVHDNDSAVRW